MPLFFSMLEKLYLFIGIVLVLPQCFCKIFVPKMDQQKYHLYLLRFCISEENKSGVSSDLGMSWRWETSSFWFSPPRERSSSPSQKVLGTFLPGTTYVSPKLELQHFCSRFFSCTCWTLGPSPVLTCLQVWSGVVRWSSTAQLLLHLKEQSEKPPLPHAAKPSTNFWNLW